MHCVPLLITRRAGIVVADKIYKKTKIIDDVILEDALISDKEIENIVI